jgi:hypothetical protein
VRKTPRGCDSPAHSVSGQSAPILSRTQRMAAATSSTWISKQGMHEKLRHKIEKEIDDYH